MKMIKKITHILWRSFLVFFFGVLFFVVFFKFVPVGYTSTMFYRSMHALFTGKDATIHYTWVSYENIADPVKVAVVASEDQRFPTHHGIDWTALKVARKQHRGGSTISQQVAKNVFLWQGFKYDRYLRKALEVPITYLIELIWGKQRILEVYLNIIEVGPRTFGVQKAAQRYFRKNAKKITAAEAALIAAVLPNPRKYLILNPSGTVRLRQRHTLYQMRLLGGASYLEGLRKF
ncbi:monofunctional biosynthetic peptidoglycan transglycosylase [Microscilla marina]|uniref:Biosynthetic peptidoglycan transglycosylase n=1 Tax=Microscilla marina ATCC 23134 TaxID=313606 RepID=A1ZSU1_MICM2|nr:monofunctional biosynthetic peptidoglycan transglycosylase [Microscilla marina]EAY26505.1 monofunctional biosynthetic peptidoglycan transglycosylase [Microscilla marina ATCC 23134]